MDTASPTSGRSNNQTLKAIGAGLLLVAIVMIGFFGSGGTEDDGAPGESAGLQTDGVDISVPQFESDASTAEVDSPEDDTQDSGVESSDGSLGNGSSQSGDSVQNSGETDGDTSSDAEPSGSTDPPGTFDQLTDLAPIRIGELPPEAWTTLELIGSDGPFPYSKDGTVFQNREGILPQHPQGYYHEYTVKTPGASNRGARRIVTGDNGEFFYTGDHYESFAEIVYE